MFFRWSSVLSSFVLGFVLASAACVFADELPAKTALDDYVNKPDGSYRWKVVSEEQVDGMKLVVVDMTSQTWRTKDEVNRTEWQHWMKFVIPDKANSEFAFLRIGGGSNRPGRTPGGPDELAVRIAQATGTVVAELGMVPNQPLIFHDDGQPRVEDDLIGYTWDQYIKTGDPTWPARNPMVKSAVRAMDTVTALLASDVGGGRTVNKFVVAGASKRGWTTWLAGLDDRVAAIIPIVIDVVNVEPSMQHHFAAYGFWAPAIGNYVQHRITERMDHPRMAELYRLVDPYYYRHRLEKPKYMVNASGDQFFLPDSSRFYFRDLAGQKHLRYVPNADHGLDGSDALESITAFYSLIAGGQNVPRFTWTEEADGTIRVQHQDPPAEVRLWQATNSVARDFRVETLGREYTSRVLQDQGDGVYLGRVDPPEKGWTAYFVELAYNVGPLKLKMTTGVRVVPDVMPYEGKASHLAAHITVICKAPHEDTAAELVRAAPALAKERLGVPALRASRVGVHCYFNWAATEDTKERDDRRAVESLAQWLQSRQCTQLRIQLESGPGITGFDNPAGSEDKN